MSYTIRKGTYGWDVLSPTGAEHVEATARHPRSKGQAAAIATALTMADKVPVEHGRAIAQLMLEGATAPSVEPVSDPKRIGETRFAIQLQPALDDMSTMNTNANDIAARLLADPSLCALCRRFGSEEIARSERSELVELGLVEAHRDNIAHGGQVFLLTSMGQVASRLGRLAELVAERKAAN